MNLSDPAYKVENQTVETPRISLRRPEIRTMELHDD